MKLPRGRRRIALLLAGALPLLADDKNLEQLHHRTGEKLLSLNHGDELLEVPSRVAAAATTMAATTITEEDENDYIPFSAVEAMHDDGFRIPPLPKMMALEEEEDGSPEVRPESSDDKVGGSTSKESNADTTAKKRVDEPTRTNTTTLATAPDPPEQNHEGGLVDSISNEAATPSSEAGILLDKVTSVVEHILERVVSSSLSSFQTPTEGETAGTKESLTSNDPERDEASSVGEMLDLVEEVPPIPSARQPENATASSDEDYENAAETKTNETLGLAESEGETMGTTVNGTLEESYNKTNTSNNSDETALSDGEKPLVQPETQNKNETINATKQQAEDDEENMTGRVAVDYASKSAGALILERSNTIKGTSNLLNGDKDRYAIAPCEDKKFVVIGLSEDILVKQIVLANYERFSSPVKDFQVMGSQTMGKFVDLGTFSALAGNGEQTFDLVEPAWARYLKFKFLSHHGSEYYCTLTQIKVHGSTMLQGFHEQWEDSEQEEGNNSPMVDEPLATTNEAPQSDSSGNSSKNTPLADEKTGSHVVGEAEEETNATPKVQGGTLDTVTSVLFSKGPSGSSGAIPDCAAGRGCDNHGSGILTGLERFRARETLDGMLHGTLIDAKNDELFRTIFDLIPQSLGSALPVESLNSPGRKNECDVRMLSQLTTSAVQSLSWTSHVADAAKALLVNEISSTIGTPKMSDTVEDLVRRVKATVEGRGVDVQTEALSQPKQGRVGDSHNTSANDIQESSEGKENIVVLEENQDIEKNQEEVKTDEVHTTETMQSHQKTHPVSKETTEAIAEDVPSSSTQEKMREQETETPLADTTRAIDLTLAKMLERLPNADCLTGLDYAEFKAKILASRKASSGGSGTTHGGGEKEPIFKKLTDEIKLLQTSLSVHDQFTKASVSCYQRVLLELVADMELMRRGQEVRMLRLEEDMLRRNTSLLSKLSSFTLAWLSFCLASTRWVCNVVIGFPAITFDAVLSMFQHTTTIFMSTGHKSRFTQMTRPLMNRLHDVAAAAFGIEDGLDGSSDRVEQLRWVIPMFPAIAVLILCRLMMTFTRTRSTTDLKAKPVRLGKVSSAKNKVGNMMSPIAKRSREITGKVEDTVPARVDDECQPRVNLISPIARKMRDAAEGKVEDDVPPIVDDESQSCGTSLVVSSFEESNSPCVTAPDGQNYGRQINATKK
jgi:hypothetical protein